MGERESPLGINATVGAVVVVGCCVVPPGLTGAEIDARLGVLAVGLAAFAAAVVDVAAVAVSVGVGFGLFDGFVEGHHGDLVWNGRADVVRVGVLCLGGLVGLVIGAVRLRAERRALPAAAVSARKSSARPPDLPLQRTCEPAGDPQTVSRASPGPSA